MKLLAIALIGSAVLSAASLRPDGLRCEYRIDPEGMDVTLPRLSWELKATDPAATNLRQTAYRVLVAASRKALAADQGDLWDTGKVASGQSIQLEYAGKPLESRAQAFWKVQAWDQDGRPSGWSTLARWSMGLLAASGWQGKWIGRDEPEFFKDPRSPFHWLKSAQWLLTGDSNAKYGKTVAIPANRRIRRATAVMAGDESFVLLVNGERAGKGASVQMPERFDLLPYLRAGQNRIEASVTRPETRTKPGGLIGAIRVEFATGDPLIVSTDRTWEGANEAGEYGRKPWGELGFNEERVLAARHLRKEFDAAKPVRRATVYLAGLGLFELYLNGAKVSDHVLSPGLTDYDKRVQYLTFDVTRQIAAGRNAIGVWLGNGRYWAPRLTVPIGSRSFGYPKLLLQLEVEHTDGTRTTVVSDESWRLTTEGPIAANNEYDGEEYDATREMAGWSKAGFDDSKWKPAQKVAAPAGILVAQMAEPLRVIETLKPVKITQPKPGVWIYDLGQNMVGWTRIKVRGPRGAEVRIRHAEAIGPDGMLYVDNLRSARATNLYTLKGGGEEVWEPRFTYHGFRYVELTGWPSKPGLDAVEARVVHDAMARTGSWESSDALLNRLHRNIYWGIRGNYRSIPTDCPQRDERQGWLGDRSVVSRSESYMFDIAAFYSKWVVDIEDSQKPDGTIPDVAPNYWMIYTDDVTWPSTFLLSPATLLDQYGDTRVIERHYPAMKRWIEHMRGFLQDGLLPKDTFGDWCVPPESPELIHSKDPARKTEGRLLGTAYYTQMLRLMARYARLLGKESDAKEYEALAGTVAAAFHKQYFNAGTGLYGNGTQTSSILPLAFGIAPPEARSKLFDSLVKRIATESNNHVGTGLVGAQWLMRTLSENGRPDLAYTIATQKTYPGWGYMVAKDATTVWELWNGDTADPAMNSGNHVMQIGDLNVWLYEYLAGIRPDPAQPGFKHIVIRPVPVSGLAYVKATHRSMYGEITSHWRREGGKIVLDVTIPPNTTASVYTSAQAPVEVGSGRHTFTLTQ